MNKKEFIEELAKLGICLNTKQEDQLEKFYNLLIEWNQKINLTRITKKEDVYLKHFYDSLTISKVVDLNKVETLCDVGTGAGFPGIVLKIVYPNLNITLVDSLLKRVNYLNEIIKELGLSNINAIHIRAEEYKEQFDIVTARAVASLDKLIPWCWHLVKENGRFIAMKANIENEILESNKILNKKQCKIEKIETLYLPKEESLRNLVVIKK